MPPTMGLYEGDKTYEDGKQYADDNKLLVRFEVRATKNEFRSKNEGRPIFEDAEYISILIPGTREASMYPLDDHYKARFRGQYEKWKASSENQTIDGTPLAELTWLSKSQVAELNFCNVITVEQLAGLSDTNARQFMGNFQLRERAKNYLAQAAGEQPLLKLQAELEERDNRIQVLEGQMQELINDMKDLQKKK